MSRLRLAMVLALAPCLLAATQDRELNLQVPATRSGLPPPPPPIAGPPPRFQPAPLPNRDAEIAPPRASTGTTMAPTLFTRPNEYHGDGFSKGSTAQSEQEKRVRPGAGFSLHMPLTPN